MNQSEDFGELTGDWDYQSLAPNVRLGRDCWIERKASFDAFRSTQEPGLVMGDRVRIFSRCQFNVEPSGVVEIGDDAVLVGGVFMCANRVVVGRRVLISYNVTIADADFHPLDVDMRQRDAIAISPSGDRSQRPPYESAPVVIEDAARIGIGAMVLKGVRVGRGAQIAAGAVVARDVPPFTQAVGNPAKIVELD